MPGGFNIYHGLGGPDAIDWDAPVAFIPEGEDQARVNIALAPDERHVFAARAVSPGGVEEQGAHVLAWAEVDEDGKLVPSLFAPRDLAGRALASGGVLLNFTYPRPAGAPEPEQYEVLTDHATGTLDLESPAAVVTPAEEGQEEFEAAPAEGWLPARFAVRARIGDHRGPLSQAIVVNVATPAIPVLL